MTFSGIKTYSDPSYIFPGVKRSPAPGCTFLSSETNHASVTCTGVIIDDILRVVLIWSSVALLWEGILESVVNGFIAVLLPDLMMIVVGYVGVFLLMTIVRAIAETAVDSTESGILKVLMQDVYVLGSTVVTAVLWRGRLAKRALLLLHMSSM